jgi:hypothetical protein
MNEDFARPLGPAIPKPPPAAPKSVEIKPGIWQAPDGKLETRDPTPMVITPIPAPSSNLAEVCAEAVRQLEAVCGTALIGFKPAETPLPVVPNAVGSCWVEHDGVTPPADLSLQYDLVYSTYGQVRSCEGQAVYASIFVTRDGWQIIRYRISVPQ